MLGCPPEECKQLVDAELVVVHTGIIAGDGAAGITKAEPMTAVLSGERIRQDRAAWPAGIIARTIVPAPAWLSISSVPPSPVARSRIVLRPK